MSVAIGPDGVRLHFAVTGIAGGEPLLLVAGQGQTGAMWDDVRADFEATHRVIVWDHRGTGESDEPEAPPYSIKMFACDALCVLDAVGVERAHVYGVSMGGRVAQRLAIDAPGRCGALALGCTSPGNLHGIERDPDVLAIMAGARDDPALADAALDLMVTPEWAAANPASASRIRAMGRGPDSARSRFLHFLASERHEAWDELPDIRNPVLVIHGTDDRVNPPGNARLLADRIPGAELLLIPGGRHGFFVEDRDVATPAILDFLGQHPLHP